jgi:hypothetical protein
MSNATKAPWVMAALATLTLLSVNAAQADTWRFKDVLKPHGHARNMAAKYADGKACGANANHRFTDGSAFESCMRDRGWVVDRRTPERSDVAARQPRRGRTDPSRYIDPDTGMDCQNHGGVAICDPPKGTVKYYDPEQGLNCTRTGLVAVCSNF